MSDELDELVLEYRSRFPVYEAFTKSLCGVLGELLASNGFEVLPLEMRTKDVDSFDKKIRRDNKVGKYSQVEDITDLSGVRVISFLQEECDEISGLIEENFMIDTANSVKKDDELDADKFGYLSRHFIVSYDEARLKVGEFRRYAGLKAEVQVRTILQHAWAAIDWKLRYKNRDEVPKELRRKLFRISALLEAADDDFSSVSSRIDELRRQYGAQIERGNLDIPINGESCAAYVERSDTVRKIADIATSLQIMVDFEEAATSGKGRVGPFLATLDELGIKEIANIDALLSQFAPIAQSRLTGLVNSYPELKLNFALYGLLRFAVLDVTTPTARRRVAGNYPFVPQEITRYLLARSEKKKTRRKLPLAARPSSTTTKAPRKT